MVKGAVEHRYGMVARPRITANVWEQLPAMVREALDAASLDQIWDVVTRAATQDKMSRPDSHMARRVARLDEEGFAEMSTVVGQTVDKLLEIEKQSAQRLQAREPGGPDGAVAMSRRTRRRQAGISGRTGGRRTAVTPLRPGEYRK
jgi:hypothetical protein